jgi:autotransporter adhesin
MNKIYRTIWNETLGAWVAASEVDSARGRRGSVLSSVSAVALVTALTVSFTPVAQAAVATSDLGDARSMVFPTANIGGAMGGKGASASSNGIAIVGDGDCWMLNPNSLTTRVNNQGVYGFGSLLGGSTNGYTGGLYSLSGTQYEAVGGYDRINAGASGKGLSGWGVNDGSHWTTPNQAAGATYIEGYFFNYLGGNGSQQTQAFGLESLAMGCGSHANGAGSTAIGWGATANNVGTVALGIDPSATGQGAIAIGTMANAPAIDTIALGTQANAVAPGAIAIGAQSNATGAHSLALGINAMALADNSTAIGTLATVSNTTSQPSVAIGYGSTVTGNVTGTSTVKVNGATYKVLAGTTPVGTVSVGSPGAERTITNVAAGQVSATSTDAINGAVLYAALGLTGVAGGTAPGDNATALGNNASATGANSTAVGANANASGDNSTALGANAKATGANSTALGANANASGDNSTAVGANAKASGDNSTATGANSVASGSNSTALGANAKATGDSSTALGANTLAAGSHSTALGEGANASGNDSLVMGSGATDNGVANSTLVGTRARIANTVTDSSVALGTDSVVSGNAVGTSGATIRGTHYSFAGTQPVGTVSVGAPGAERTITNVAAGRVTATSTDAVNGSQLYATDQAIEALDTGLNEVTEVFHYNNTTNSIEIGANVSGTGANSIAIGNNTTAGGDNSVVIGKSATDNGVGNSTVLGANAKIEKDAKGSSVALGANSIADTAVGTPGMTIRGNYYSFAGTQPVGTVSVGAPGAERTITNVAAGRVTATSTDAVNGSQLYATDQAIEALDTGLNKVTEVFHYNNTTNSIEIGANVSGTGANSIAIGNNTTAGGDNSVVIGKSATDNGVGNSTVLGANASIAPGAKGSSVALGANSIADTAVGTPGMTIRGAYYSFAGTQPVGTVSVGAPGAERTITNVAAGRVTATSTDAVNGSQLYATDRAIEALDTGLSTITEVFHYNTTTNAISIGITANGTGANSIAIGNNTTAGGENSVVIGKNATDNGVANSTVLGANAKIEKNATGSSVALGANSIADTAVGTPGMTIAGNYYSFAGTQPVGTVSVGAPGAERTITNVAAGRVTATSTDAINGSQLYATDQAVDALNTRVDKIAGGVGGIDSKGTGANSTQLGENATASGANSTAIGSHATASGSGSTAVGAGSTASGTNSTALGEHANASAIGATAVGSGAKAAGAGSTALGTDADALGANSLVMGSGATDGGVGNSTVVGTNARIAGATDSSVALGTNSQVNGNAVGTPGMTIRETYYSFAGTQPVGTVSVGAPGAERTITNVAAGRVTATSTDAVNGSQLWATDQAIEALGTEFANFRKDGGGGTPNNANPGSGPDSTATGPNATASGPNSTATGANAKATGDNSTATGANAKASGANSTATGANSTASGDNSTATGANSLASGDNSTATGANSKATGDNSTAMGANSAATGPNSTAVGAGSSASGDNSTALGANAKAPGNNSVALGAGSVADRDNTVSVGSPGHERTISNVAPGIAGTDAVNVNQLNSLGNQLMNQTNDVARKAYTGIAAAMALQAPALAVPGKTVMRLGAGTYQGQGAAGISFRRTSDSGNWSVSGGVAGGASGGAAATLGVDWVFQ